MKKSSKRILAAIALGMSALLVSGCTQSFCTNKEKARIMYAYEPGVTSYYETNDPITIGEGEEAVQKTPEKLLDFDHIYYLTDESFAESKLTSILKNSRNNGYRVPHLDYWEAVDTRLVNDATNLYMSSHNITTAQQISDFKATLTVDGLVSQVLKEYGYIKFLGTGDKSGLLEWYNELNTELAPTLGLEKMPSKDFVSYYQSQMKATASNVRTCITTIGGDYGSFGSKETAITMEAKTWGEAWGKGFIEGLLVYPVAWMVDVFSNAFGYKEGVTNAIPQLLALILVTLIVRLLLVAFTFKSTLNQQKMTALQPEIAKLQQKYPNSKENKAQQQRLAMETQELYKKHGINPLSSLLVLFIPFPIFIGVWNGLSCSAVLASGEFLGLKLSDSIGSIITGYIANGGFTANNGGWWTAVVIYLIMAATQVVSMQITNWIQKYRAKKNPVEKLVKSNTEAQNNKTMKIFSWVMIGMILVMGFSLPSAMAVYWLIGALISILQTVITQAVLAKKGKKNKKGAKK